MKHKRTRLDKFKHKLFKCPTFWQLKSAFQCPLCGKKYRCYWDGNDTDQGTHVCNRCAKIQYIIPIP